MKRTILFLSLLLTVAVASVRAKTLVAYYSYTGNCKAIANALSGHVSNLAGIIRVEALGDTSGIQPMRADNGQSASRSYALNGRVAEEGRPGIIVRDGKGS